VAVSVLTWEIENGGCCGTFDTGMWIVARV
jgi:hypothetical protein